MSESSKVLVTGGAGFIGGHLISKLLEKGYRVIVLDNFYSGKLENLRPHLKNDNFEVVKGDVRDRKIVEHIVEGVDKVVHLAALIDVEQSVSDPFETHDVNVNGTLNILGEIGKKGVERFVFASSTAVYGEARQLPLEENCSLNPASPYAASKVCAENYCEAFRRSYGLDFVVLRYFNVYGPGQQHNPYSGVIVKFLRNALGNKPLTVFGEGEQTRDFVYVDDVVEATMLALERRNALGEIFNVCTGVPISINKLVLMVREATARSPKVIYGAPRKGDIKESYGEPVKAKEILGFEAKVSLRDGLGRIVKNMII